jgi:hypothetical protein
VEADFEPIMFGGNDPTILTEHEKRHPVASGGNLDMTTYTYH